MKRKRRGHSEETKQKIGAANRGRKYSEEYKKKMSLFLKGRRYSEEHRRKISLSLIGKKHSEKTKLKISKSNKGKKRTNEQKLKSSLDRKGKFTGKDHPFYGKHHTKESKEKISRANTGNRWSHTEETKLKLKTAHTGKKLSKEHIKKISDSLKGKTGINSRNYGNKHTEETKRKMSIKLKGRISPMKGISMSISIKKKISESLKGRISWNKGIKCYQIRGSKNGNWQGGKSFEPYGLEFNAELRELIRERDNYCCRLCGIKQVNKKLDVHHIDYNKQNNDPINLITLCRNCHSKTNSNRNKYTKVFTKLCISGFKIINIPYTRKVLL